ncbi:hypothetical protein N9100_02525 [Gammaproteobacteria bacterium]|nr:hypothetical protein [Gammaproteobacteria bacterium]
MTDKKSSENRRKLLKSIAAGSGAIVAGKSLPESWSRPVVDSVMLPAHAQTSQPELSTGPFAGGATTQLPALESDSLFSQINDTLVPQAQAGAIEIIDYQNPYVCVEPNFAGDNATVKLYIDRGEGLQTRLYTFNNVPLDGSKDADSETKLCDAADVGDLLNDLGLLKDAHAAQTVRCFLDSVSGVGAGRCEFDSGPTIDFSVGEGSCNPTINCGGPD